ncbi:acetyltransferase [Vibrio cholerae]|nr:acetyltransferase [Vibrio cholerae]
MVAVVVFEFSVMRCQPLRRALYLQSVSEFKNESSLTFLSNIIF